MSRFPLTVIASLILATSAFSQSTGTLPQNAEHNWLRDPGLKSIPTDGFVFASVKASKLWDNPASKPFRDWVASQKVDPIEEMHGIKAADIDRVTLFMPSASGSAPLLFVTTRKPYSEARVRKLLSRDPDERRIDRGEDFANDRVVEIHGNFRWMIFVDDHTMLFFPEERRGSGGGSGWALIAQLLARKADGPLAAALSEATQHDFSLGLDIAGFRKVFEREPLGARNPFKVFLQLLKADKATLTADFGKTATGKLVLNFPDAATAKQAAPLLEEGFKTIIEMLAQDANERRPDPMRKAFSELATAVLKNAKVTTEGDKAIASVDVPYADDVAKLVATFPKSLASDRDRMTASNNTKILALGLHNYHDTFQVFPGDVGHERRLAWSWRIQILPYVEQNAIYAKLDMKKPWDDPANLKVLQAAEMPKIFEIPGRPAPKGHTYFRIFSLPKEAKPTDNERSAAIPFFEEGKRGKTLNAISDGTSNTLMVVEAGEAVPWYKPDVLAYDGKLPLPQLGDKDADSFLAAMADASVRIFKPSKLGEKTLRAMITCFGGEVLPDLDK